MTVQVEEYRITEVIDLDEDEEAKRRKELVATLGFNPQLQCVDELSVDASRFYPELTGFDLQVWTLFHRSYYEKSKGEWEGYHFDRVPTKVLEEISVATSLEVFDDLELWTPEGDRKDLDPMAVGVVGHRLGDNDYTVKNNLGLNAAFNSNARFFPITRWGESLLPFDDIKRLVQLTRMKLGWDVPSTVPDAIVEYTKPLFEKNPRARIRLEKGSWLARHCNERMLKVNGTHVCVACGHAEQ